MDTEKKEEVIAEAPPVEEVATTENPATPSAPVPDQTPPVAEAEPAKTSLETPVTSMTKEAAKPAEKPTVSKAPKLHQAPVGVVVVAVVIATALAGLTVFTYMRSSPPTDVPTAKTTTQPAPSQTLQASEIDTAVSDAENSLNATNDETDFSDNDLNDTTLGL